MAKHFKPNTVLWAFHTIKPYIINVLLMYGSYRHLLKYNFTSGWRHNMLHLWSLWPLDAPVLA